MKFCMVLKILIKNTLICVSVIFLLIPFNSFAYQKVIASERDVYTLTFTNKETSIPLRVMHDWQVSFKTKNGKLFIPGHISIGGGMPSHGHGLPSEPRFTRAVNKGKLLLSGVLFNMSGEWEIRITFTGPEGLDTVIFPLEVQNHKALVEKDAIDQALVSSMHIDQVEVVKDPTNKYLNNEIAISLGQKLFFDTKLSRSGAVSCSTCHNPKFGFSDGRKKSFGTAETKRHSPTLTGVSHSQWFYWDGRRDSLWAQAVTPIETQGEMDNNRAAVVHYLLSDKNYRASLKELDNTLDESEFASFPKSASPFGNKTEKENWGKLPQEQKTAINFIFSLIGKSLAAYITTIQHTSSKFDDAVGLIRKNKNTDLTVQQYNGLRLFFDAEKTHCLRCHNGPLLTNHGFHNIGTGPDSNNNFDYGHLFGIQAVAYDMFNCNGKFSDAPDKCEHVEFAKKVNLPSTAAGAFKVPSLRNVLLTSPYMHDGRFKTLKEVVEFYSNPPDVSEVPHELPSLELTEQEIDELVEFLKIL